MNVLFIISHDISLRFACYGDTLAVTPNIDRLAAESMLFENHFCQYALCAPSRTNIFTGCRPDTARRFAIGNAAWYEGFRSTHPWVRTLPEHLKNHGWYTRNLHKLYHECELDPPSWSEKPWYAPWEPAQPWMPDDFECLDRATRYRNPESWKIMGNRFDSLITEEPEASTAFKRWRGPPVESAAVVDDEYPAGKVASRACRALHDLKDRQPFFLGIGFAVIHLPWLAPQQYWDLIPEAKINLPQNMSAPEGVPEEFGLLGNEAYQYYEQNYHEPGAALRWKPDTRDARRMTHGYYAAISYLDVQIGRILHTLGDEQLSDDTIVVFTTDHGFAVGEHGHWGKHSLHEPDLRVPLIIREPEHRPGRTAALTEHVDVYPTLCELLDQPIPDFVEDASLAPLMVEPSRPWKEAVFSQARGGACMGYSIRTEQFRYTRWLDDSNRTIQEELYDYRKDPLEMTSVHAIPRYTATLSNMSSLLDRGWRAVREDIVS